MVTQQRDTDKVHTPNCSSREILAQQSSITHKLSLL